MRPWCPLGVLARVRGFLAAWFFPAGFGPWLLLASPGAGLPGASALPLLGTGTLCPLFALFGRFLPRLGLFGFAPVGLALLVPWSGAPWRMGVAFAWGGLVRVLFVPVPSFLVLPGGR